MRWLVAFAAALLLGAASPSPYPAIRLHSVPGSVLSMTAFIAEDRGFFKQNGLDLTLVPFTTTPAAEAALEAGNIEVFASSPEFVVSLVERGDKLQLFAGNSMMPFDLLAGPTILTLGDLRGKRVGLVGGLRSPSQLIAQALLENAGVPNDQVSWIPTDGPATTLAAINHGDIDADVTFDPGTTQIVLNTKWHLIAHLYNSKTLPESVRGHRFGGLWAKTAFIEQNRGAIEALRRAMCQADVWMHDPKNFGEVEKLYGQRMGNAVPSGSLAAFVRSTLPLLGTSYSAADLEAWIAFGKRNGVLKGTVPAQAMIVAGTPATPAEVRALARR